MQHTALRGGDSDIDHSSICLFNDKSVQAKLLPSHPTPKMKSFVAVIATIAALTSQASAATCSTAVLSALLTNQYIDQCSSDSGYVFTAASIPTAEVMEKMCASSACKSLLADAQAMDLTECTLPVGDGINLLGDLVDYVPEHCPATDAPANDSPATPATEAPSTPTTEAPSTPTTEAPSTPTTDAPSTPTTEAPTAC
ncbi:hypothetical protein BBO99_00008920 [Phytophthora kernoviae]|uniref:Elicitin n=1 Tax=Phytophthora kernoviae TaxID=325452 RepID=A0A421GDT1_9STRA|nr:hypothetical protein BBI17_008945 [Phytophthora kernoviae]RLN74462.1 hypothetical protein BBO99_00008920 [Phytophthora kernoviae]